MRILFGFAGGTGHFRPLVPTARAARAAGHTVAFACASALVPTVEAAGFPAIATGTIDYAAPPERMPLLPHDPDREHRDVRDFFAGRLARDRAAGVLDVCAGWRPDLFVCDEADYGGIVAADRLALPYATVVVIAAGSFIRDDLVAAPLNEIRAEHGLPPDPDLTMLRRHLVLCPVPAGFRDPAAPLPATAHLIRPEPSGTAMGDAVYFTLGTIFNMESGDLFPRILAGLRDVDATIVVTLGAHLDPAEFGPQPANVHIGRFIPQEEILPRCAAVVSHAGSGSVLGALGYGLPMVLVPMGADQPYNAARCAELGVARVLDPVTVTPHEVRDAVRAVLADPGYRRAAQRLRDEIVALPGPEHAVTLLEKLVSARAAGR